MSSQESEQKESYFSLRRVGLIFAMVVAVGIWLAISLPLWQWAAEGGRQDRELWEYARSAPGQEMFRLINSLKSGDRVTFRLQSGEEASATIEESPGCWTGSWVDSKPNRCLDLVGESVPEDIRQVNPRNHLSWTDLAKVLIAVNDRRISIRR